jgi:hypothetical protein
MPAKGSSTIASKTDVIAELSTLAYPATLLTKPSPRIKKHRQISQTGRVAM